jgi:cardiolipin synthase C
MPVLAPSSVMSKHTVASLLLGGMMLGLTACSTLPKNSIQPIEHAFDTPTDQTQLAQIVLPLREKYPQLTGYHLLPDPLEALAARLHLIDKAEKTLDLQYYIWDNDKVGALALDGIIRAADRGVKVRLLIDDNNSKKMQGIYLALDQHANIEVRLFNPYRFRYMRTLDIALDLKRINRRMHNKSFIVDNQVALIGGRNMSNQYYNVSDNYQFSDVDVMLVGSASDEIIHSFDEYWNDDYAYPVVNLIDPKKYRLDFYNLKQQVADHSQLASVQNFLDLTARADAFEQWLQNDIQLNWVEASVVKDPPNKIKSLANKDEYLYAQLAEQLTDPEHSVDIISAYFVPQKNGAQLLKDLSDDGVKVRVLTNSYQANDVGLVHAFYAKYRHDLLKNDVELYEFLSTPEFKNLNKNTDEISKKSDVSLKGLSRSSLHAKIMALDEKQVFVGSFNFDPRSLKYNSEIGVVLNSPNLARAVHQTMDQNLSKYAYKLVLNANDKINWQLKNSQGETKIFSKEPKIKWWQKAGLKVISWLPLEDLM